jgi:hypothetical protein
VATPPRRGAVLSVGSVVGLLAVLGPRVGAAAPAGARTAVRAGAVAASGASVAAGPGVGDPRRHGRVADRVVRGTVRLTRGERPAGHVAPRLPRLLHAPFTPASPATCGADPTGPPATWSTLLHHRTHRHAGRRTPVGAGRSPPAPRAR